MVVESKEMVVEFPSLIVERSDELVSLKVRLLLQVSVWNFSESIQSQMSRSLCTDENTKDIGLCSILWHAFDTLYVT
jgi:hypothetical protein